MYVLYNNVFFISIVSILYLLLLIGTYVGSIIG